MPDLSTILDAGQGINLVDDNTNIIIGMKVVVLGLADDWQAAYNAASAPTRFIHESGTKEISATLSLPGGNVYEYYGVTIQQANGANLSVMLTTPTYLSNSTSVDEPLYILGGKIVGNTANNTGPVTAAIIRAYRAVMRDVTVNDVDGDGLVYSAESANATVPTGTMVECGWFNCKVYINANTTGACFKVQDADATAKATDGFCMNCVGFGGKEGILMEQSAGWQIDNFHGYATNDYGLHIFKAYAVRISNVYLEGFGEGASWRVGIYLQGMGNRGSTIVGGSISTDQTTGTSIGIYAEAQSGATADLLVATNINLPASAATETAMVLEAQSTGTLNAHVSGTISRGHDTFVSTGGSGTVNLLGDRFLSSQTTVGAAGGASAPPATPTKYLKVKDETGTTYVIPAYAES